MKFDPERFRVREGNKVDLTEWQTRVEPLFEAKSDSRDQLKKQVSALSRLQQLFYAANSHALLVIFQAMDAAGKDSTIRHVMSGVNPQGCQVYSFKHPSTQELQHDFLWRTTRDLPERGRIGIFNRSYYEDVLIARVHPSILHTESVPGAGPPGKDIWRERYRSINALERHLHENGTRILKFFLHISKAEQARRFVDRIDDPEKNWKFTGADIEERGFWDDYMKAYEKCLAATSTNEAPWHVIPADDKDNCRLFVSRVIVDTLKNLKMEYPTTSSERREELLAIRSKLVN